jgi:hypothetical protein
MNTHPVRFYGDVLVVLEGHHRVTWQRRKRAEWVPVAVWPNAAQAERVQRRIRVGQPVLIVAERPETCVPVLDEQLAAAPPAVAARVDGDGEAVVDLRIPAFDWLPQHLRERGLEFLRSSHDRAQRMPASLTPPVVLDEVPAQNGHVRFVHVLRSFPQLTDDLHVLAASTFGEPLRMAA